MKPFLNLKTSTTTSQLTQIGMVIFDKVQSSFSFLKASLNKVLAKFQNLRNKLRPKGAPEISGALKYALLRELSSDRYAFVFMFDIS